MPTFMLVESEEVMYITKVTQIKSTSPIRNESIEPIFFHSVISVDYSHCIGPNHFHLLPKRMLKNRGRNINFSSYTLDQYTSFIAISS